MGDQDFSGYKLSGQIKINNNCVERLKVTKREIVHKHYFTVR